jgi:hypothetical protein
MVASPDRYREVLVLYEKRPPQIMMRLLISPAVASDTTLGLMARNNFRLGVIR